MESHERLYLNGFGFFSEGRFGMHYMPDSPCVLPDEIKLSVLH
jgi:hypothetical protein